MILIADCGSTKIHWCLLDNEGGVAGEFFTGGINALMLSREEISSRFADELMPLLPKVCINKAFFYGAGCVSPDVCDSVADALRDNIPSLVSVEVTTDLLAAARALCGHNPGVACILGTGSNSCYYDGTRIVDNVSPLGYILGDEGSGAVLGRTLVGDVLKSQLPADLCDKFLKRFDLDRLTIIRRVYREPQANRFLASLAPFLLENIDRPEIRDLVYNSFRAFFVRNVCHYPQAAALGIGFVGSIAYYYGDILRDAAASCGLTVTAILRDPMPGLITYHTT